MSQRAGSQGKGLPQWCRWVNLSFSCAHSPKQQLQAAWGDPRTLLAGRCQQVGTYWSVLREEVRAGSAGACLHRPHLNVRRSPCSLVTPDLLHSCRSTLTAGCSTVACSDTPQSTLLQALGIAAMCRLFELPSAAALRVEQHRQHPAHVYVRVCLLVAAAHTGAHSHAAAANKPSGQEYYDTPATSTAWHATAL